MYIKITFIGEYKLEESRVYISIGFKIDEDIMFEFYNFPSDKLTQIGNSEEDISIKLKEIKWYMYGLYDFVEIFEENWLITNKTKKKVTLVKGN